jgi:molybdate transport system ATP-binding protein
LPQTPFLSLEDVTFEAGGRPALAGVSLRIGRDEQWAIVGPNGSGKSLLLRGLAGGLVIRQGRLRHQFLEGDPRCRDSTHGVLPHGTIALVASPAAGSIVGTGSPFHQVRWHATESHGQRVGELLTYAAVEAVNPFRVDAPAIDLVAFERVRRRAITSLGLEPLLERGVLELSQGERRLLLLARALCRSPRLLLVDDPFTGLDTARRERLRALFANLVACGCKVVLAARRMDEVPDWVTHVARLAARRLVEAGPRGQVVEKPAPASPLVARPELDREGAPETAAGEPLIEMRDVQVRYGSKVILEGIDWTVRSSEHWAVVGANGAGKSTLLSLVLGDNPQAYANDVRLFGRRRGSGETIWELRHRVGWTGPELLAHFPAATTLLDVVCSGFSGTLGPIGPTDPGLLARAHELLRLFAIGELASRALAETPDAERRLALIARALVHRPALLILDEPSQGLDRPHVALVRDAVDAAVGEGVASLIFVTHEVSERPRCITHALELEAGRVTRSGPLLRGGAAW